LRDTALHDDDDDDDGRWFRFVSPVGEEHSRVSSVSFPKLARNNTYVRRKRGCLVNRERRERNRGL
jgi:hypothetical protein